MQEQFKEFELQLHWFSGYITEPNITYLENGKCKTMFSIPLKKNKEDEAKWLNCIVWNKLAETVAEYKKGDLVLVGGYFTEREYNNKKFLDFNTKVAIKC